MRFADVLQLAWTGLRQNKLRSGLTSIGVTVGVFELDGGSLVASLQPFEGQSSADAWISSIL